ncbi:hypothetical protein AMELA_G00089460 [Ameiurus melas]|uniref:Uncharacterized protein n=1 Tax=Ameiurus melas TaxID=219545 RepID=A0A7J6AW15_AMEME|nr:hypothetical protein AMELA_G00089460 [Ameiurus melas]
MSFTVHLQDELTRQSCLISGPARCGLKGSGLDAIEKPYLGQHFSRKSWRSGRSRTSLRLAAFEVSWSYQVNECIEEINPEDATR